MLVVALITLSCYSSSASLRGAGGGWEGGLGFCPHPVCARGLLHNTNPSVLVESWRVAASLTFIQNTSLEKMLRLKLFVLGRKIYIIRINTPTGLWRERTLFTYPQ